MKTKHTPGPWKVAKSNSLVAYQVESADEVVALTPHYSGSCVANANLIAAAPELLQIAEWAIAAFGFLECKATSDSDKAEFRKRRDTTYAAIAKARGES